MKKIALVLVFILTVSAGFSQQRKRMVRKTDKMSTEQRTTLAVKKLTLALDLDQSQAKKVQKLYSKMAKVRMEKGAKMKKEGMVKREKMMKIKKASKDTEDFKKRVKRAVEKGELKKEDLGRMRRNGRGNGRDFDSANKTLDMMIAHQTEMKKILTKEQFATYKKMQKRRVKAAKGKRSKMVHKKGKMAKRSKMTKHTKVKKRH